MKIHDPFESIRMIDMTIKHITSASLHHEEILRARSFLRIHKQINAHKNMIKLREKKLVSLHNEVKDFDTFNGYVRKHLRTNESDRNNMDLI